AAHHFEQIEDAHVKQSLAQNTKIKFIAHTYADIRLLCRSMGRTQPDLLENLGEYEFAFHAPGMPEASTVKFPLTDFTAMPCISDEQHEELKRIARPQGFRTMPPASPARMPVLVGEQTKELE